MIMIMIITQDSRRRRAGSAGGYAGVRIAVPGGGVRALRAGWSRGLGLQLGRVDQSLFLENFLEPVRLKVRPRRIGTKGKGKPGENIKTNRKADGTFWQIGRPDQAETRVISDVKSVLTGKSAVSVRGTPLASYNFQNLTATLWAHG